MADNPPARPTVLIVDDNEQVALTVAQLLESEGYSTRYVPSGPAALAFFTDQRADLVLLDLSMPGMDGLAVLEQMRANPRLAAVPVVMFSACIDLALREDAARLGALGWLVKGPTFSDELFALLRRHAGIRPAAAREADSAYPTSPE
jgi:CheY-like chemotaxis protein